MKAMLEGRVAFVTGCDSGIGKSICTLFAKHGAIVYANVLKEESEELLRNDTDKLQGKVVPLLFDITCKNDINIAYRQIKQEEGKLDVIVNNAGVKYDGYLPMINDDMIEKMYAVNITAPIHVVQSGIKLLKKNNKGGCIVNVSSIVGLRGNSGQSIYGATKAAVASLTKSWAKEFAPYNIRVNAVAPGSINTNMFYDISPDKIQESINAIGFKRLGEPDEVAKVILFLASDLSSYVTGDIIGVDGGLYM